MGDRRLLLVGVLLAWPVASGAGCGSSSGSNGSQGGDAGGGDGPSVESGSGGGDASGSSSGSGSSGGGDASQDATGGGDAKTDSSSGGSDAPSDAPLGASWQKTWGTTNVTPMDLAVDAAGHVVVVGTFTGTVDFGGGPATASGNTGAFAVKYDAAGTYQWSLTIPSGTAGAVALEPNGDAVISAGVVGQFGVGDAGGVLCFPNTACGEMFKLSAASGAIIGYADITAPQALAIDGNGRLFVVNNSQIDSYDVNLAPVAAVSMTDGITKDLALDATGNLYAVGGFSGTASVGGIGLTSMGGVDVFAARLDTNLKPIWAVNYGGANDQSASSVTIDPAGTMLVAGRFLQTLDFGKGAMQSAGGEDGFVAALSATTGAGVWSARFGGPTDDQALDVASDAANRALFTGAYQTGADFFGGSMIANAGSDDVFIASLDSTGSAAGPVLHYGDAASQSGVAIGTDAAGDVYVTGPNAGSIDFGLGMPVGGAFLLKLSR